MAKAQVPDVALQAAINSVNIHEEANSYEWRGEGGDYTPNSHEKVMLEDFGHGLISQIEDAVRPLSAEPAQGEQWQPTHRHIKRGTEYQLIGTGKMQAENWQVSQDGIDQSIDMQEVAIYRGEDGQLWARPILEFNDGRFEPLPAAPTPEAHNGLNLTLKRAADYIETQLSEFVGQPNTSVTRKAIVDKLIRLAHLGRTARLPDESEADHIARLLTLAASTPSADTLKAACHIAATNWALSGEQVERLFKQVLEIAQPTEVSAVRELLSTALKGQQHD